MIRSNQRRVSNVWKTITIFLIFFTILSEAYLIYKIVSQNSEIASKRAEVQELLKIIHKANTGKFTKNIVLPNSISKDTPPISREGLVTEQAFNTFKKEYSEKLKKLQRELDTMRKNSLLSAQ